MRNKTFLLVVWTAVATLSSPPDVVALPSSCTNTWASVRLPERLALASWNSTVNAAPTMTPAPDPEGTGPVSITLSAPVISDAFFDIIDLTVTGLPLGQSVWLEKFRVNNDQGVIDSGALLQESHLLIDGVSGAAGETYNWNRLYNVTGRDGQIRAQLDFWEPSAASIPGEYVYRVSSPNGSFDPVSVQLTIEEDPGDQSFTGTVLNGSTPVPGTLVGILQSVGGYSHLRRVTRADENGDYRIYAPFVDEFERVAIGSGFVGPFWVGTDRVIASGQTINRDLQLTPGSRVLSGAVVDSVSNEPIAGIPVTFIKLDADGKPNGERCTHTWTDANGGFSVSVTRERLGITFRPSDVSSRSYRAGLREVIKVVDATAADQIGGKVPLVRGTSLIWGTLSSADGQIME